MNFVNQVLNPPPVEDGAPSTAGLLAGITSASGTLSGGDTRGDGRASHGFSSLRGKRPNMEDTHLAQFKTDPRTGQTLGLFGVFDGHGGPSAADYVRSNLFANMLHSKKYPRDVLGALAEAFEITDAQYLKQEVTNNHDDGCTAVAAVLIGNKLYVANVGDSRAVLCRGGKGVAVSVDHKPNSKDERQRIEGSGGVVVWAGTWRVGGVLAVSRALGDRPLKKYVISTPDVREEQLGLEDSFLLLASDGLWDVISNQEAVDLVCDMQEPEEMATRLTEEALERGSNDNITCVVVRFKMA